LGGKIGVGYGKRKDARSRKPSFFEMSSSGLNALDSLRRQKGGSTEAVIFFVGFCNRWESQDNWSWKKGGAAVWGKAVPKKEQVLWRGCQSAIATGDGTRRRMSEGTSWKEEERSEASNALALNRNFARETATHAGKFGSYREWGVEHLFRTGKGQGG